MTNDTGSRDKDTSSFRSLLERVDGDDVPTTRRRDALEALREARMKVAATTTDIKKPRTEPSNPASPILSASQVIDRGRDDSIFLSAQPSAFERITNDISNHGTENSHLRDEEHADDLDDDSNDIIIDLEQETEQPKRRSRGLIPLTIAAALGLCIGLPLLWLPSPEPPKALKTDAPEVTPGTYQLQGASMTSSSLTNASSDPVTPKDTSKKTLKTATLNTPAIATEDGWLAVIPDQTASEPNGTAPDKSSPKVMFELAPEETPGGDVGAQQSSEPNTTADAASTTAAIEAGAGDRVPVPVKLDPMHAPAGVAALLVSGLPQDYKVEGAIPTGDNNWLLLADVLSTARILIPQSAAGTLSVAVNFFDFSAKQIGRTKFDITILKASATRHTTPDETQKLAKQGLEKMKAGDIVAARLLLERAAGAGHAGSALALGEAFDPAVLATRGIVGISGDPARARFWYEKAQALGVTEADARLAALSSQLKQ